MSGKMELDTGRSEGAGESKELETQRRLDDATFEPEAAVEGTGEYREAEAIQGALATIIEGSAENRGATPLPIPRPEDASGAQLDGKGERPIPAFTLDGKGADRSSDKAGEVPLPAPEELERGPAPGEGEPSALERGAEDNGAKIQFRIQEAVNPHNNSVITGSDVKKKSEGTEEDIIKNLKG
ncbi:MAG: hypothetical protein JW929_04085 [Anaerolineales bacterium]|nr:hypothetical protein [Anaerolineales bacterium]